MLFFERNSEEEINKYDESEMGFGYKNNNINEIMIRVINDKIMLSLDTINKEVRDSFINNLSD